MNRLEAAAILVCAGLIAAVAVWLVISLVWAKRTIPPRLVLPAELRHQPGVAIPVDGDPREIRFDDEVPPWKKLVSNNVADQWEQCDWSGGITLLSTESGEPPDPELVGIFLQGGATSHVAVVDSGGAPEFEWPVSGPVPFDWARDLHTPDWSRQRV